MTDIERKVYFFLKALNLKILREKRFDYYPVDFFLPEYNLSIQTDGCRFHFHKNKECNRVTKPTSRAKAQRYRDVNCVRYHKYHNINIVRVWGCDINKRFEKVSKIILDSLKKIKTGEKVYFFE